MNCEKYEYLINDLVEGELDEQNAEQVNLHIFACQECNSLFEMMKDEKEMYSHYLFEIEPPTDLFAKFQNKLEIEEQKTVVLAPKSFGLFDRLSNAFAYLRLNPVLTMAAALILFVLSFGLFNLLRNEKTAENSQPLRATSNSPQLILPKIDKPDEDKTSPVTPPKDDIVKITHKDIKENPKPIHVKQTIVKNPETRKTNPEVVKPTEEQQQIKQIQQLELETAKQLEKVEILLRSFRNARVVEGSEQFDIAYEKQQARKLLDSNVELRQRAESYGTLFTEQMLSKVEPYLLDIANLEVNSDSMKVLEIKERVKNQNIIASLQGF